MRRWALAVLLGGLMSGCSESSRPAIATPAPELRRVPGSGPSASEPDAYRVSLRGRSLVPEPRVDFEAIVRSHRPGLGPKLHFVLQLWALPDVAQHRVLEQQGVTLSYYQHGYAYEAIASEASLRWLAKQELVRAAFPLEPADRTSPELRKGAPPPWALEADGSWDVNVMFFPDVALTDAEALISKSGGRLLGRIDSMSTITAAVPPRLVPVLEDHDSVEFIGFVEPPPTIAR